MTTTPVTPAEIEQIAQRLQAFVAQHQIAQDAIKTCRQIVERFIQNDPNYLEGLQAHQLHYAAERQMLIFESEAADTPLPFLRTRVNIYDKFDLDVVLAYYDRDTDAHGKYSDEWFIVK